MDNYTIIEENNVPRKHDVMRAGHSSITYSIIREGSSPVKGFSTREQAESAVARMHREFQEQVAYMNRNR